MINEAPNGIVFPLLRSSSKHWHAYTRHAFVEGLKDGTLPRDAFLHYLKQDYIFLIHFSRAWALAVTKAGTLDEMKACSASVNGLVNGEMQFHIETCAKIGISEEEILATVETPENLAYTRYVLEAGYSGDFISLLAALAPCIFGYGEIGLRLKAEKTSEKYADWIDTYAGDEYQDICKNAGKLLDQAVISRLGDGFENIPVWAKIKQNFDTATRLEVSFWDMSLRPDKL